MSIEKTLKELTKIDGNEDAIWDKFGALYNKQMRGESYTYEEFIQFFEMYGEVEFHHKHIRYAMFRLNDDYSQGKDKEPIPSKNYYVFDEYYNNNIAKEQKYVTLEEFAHKVHIKGRLLKDIWSEVSKVRCLG